MTVLGKDNIKYACFSDLKLGDVFCFVDCINRESNNIYMRCGYTDLDYSAVNLETGLMYSFKEHERDAVKILDCTVIINPDKREEVEL